MERTSLGRGQEIEQDWLKTRASMQWAHCDLWDFMKGAREMETQLKLKHIFLKLDLF